MNAWWQWQSDRQRAAAILGLFNSIALLVVLCILAAMVCGGGAGEATRQAAAFVTGFSWTPTAVQNRLAANLVLTPLGAAVGLQVAGLIYRARQLWRGS